MAIANKHRVRTPMGRIGHPQTYTDPLPPSNAKVAGMTKDLGMDSGQYSISLVVFFVTYVVFEVREAAGEILGSSPLPGTLADL